MVRHASRYLFLSIIVFVLFAIATALGAQEASVCRLDVHKESVRKQSGSAAVIGVATGYAAAGEGWYHGIIATAAHVLETETEGELAGDEFFLSYSNGAVVKVRVDGILARNNRTDLALLVALVPVDVKPLVLGVAKPDDMIRIMGYPSRKAETTDGRFLRYCDQEKRYFADVFCRGGYSGGICVNEKDEVVGIITGGWMWVEDDNGHKQSTWPTCGGSSNGLVALSNSLAVK